MIPRGLCQCGCGETTSIAKTTRRGYRVGEPVNFVFGHQRRKSPVEYLVDDETGCWVWQRACNDLGYPQMSVKGKVFYAHRAFYDLAKGPIPTGHVIDHLCANPSCVNPRHLEAVSHGENIKRGSRGLPPVRKRVAA